MTSRRCLTLLPNLLKQHFSLRPHCLLPLYSASRSLHLSTPTHIVPRIEGHGLLANHWRGAHALPMQVNLEEELYVNGPDQIIPSLSHKAWQLDDSVTIPLTDVGPESLPPVSVYSFLQQTAEMYPNKAALAIEREMGVWHYTTYRQYFEDSRVVAKALIKLGLDRFSGVCLMGHNSPEWFTSFYGSVFAGGIAASVYVNNTSAAAVHIAKDSNAQFAIVDTAETAEKFLQVSDSLPNLKGIIQYSGVPQSDQVMSWDEFLAIGRGESDRLLDERVKMLAVNQCCNLIYTSGTTAAPKGVMCSHDNLTWSGGMHARTFDVTNGTDTIVSYLPLNHIAGQIMDLFIGVHGGATVYFARPDALKGSLITTLRDVNPTCLLTVPRLLEKMRDHIILGRSQQNHFKRYLLDWAMSQAANYHAAKNEGRPLSTAARNSYKFACHTVLKNIKSKMGLSNIRNMATGSAPIADDLIKFFFSLDIPLGNTYGSSETVGAGTLACPTHGSYRPGSVGKEESLYLDPLSDSTHQSVGTKVLPTPLATGEGEGELAFRGRSVFMGYLNNEEKTQETIQDDGWMRTGDMGYMDSSGFLFITGRLKELIITAGGENIAPLPIEEDIARHLPIAANVMVLGDAKKYLSVLVSVKTDKDEETGAPLDTLCPSVVEWLRERGSQATTVTQLMGEVEEQPSGLVANGIQAAIDRYNKDHALSNVHQIKKWRLLPNEFSVATGELTQTLKLKRSAVSTKYQHLIDSIYHHDVNPCQHA